MGTIVMTPYPELAWDFGTHVRAKRTADGLNDYVTKVQELHAVREVFATKQVGPKWVVEAGASLYLAPPMVHT